MEPLRDRSGEAASAGIDPARPFRFNGAAA